MWSITTTFNHHNMSIYFWPQMVSLWHPSDAKLGKLLATTTSILPINCLSICTWSPCAWRPIIIDFVQPGTRRGMVLQIIGSRKTVPPRMFLMVPFGLSHIFFNLNSTQLNTQDVKLWQLSTFSTQNVISCNINSIDSTSQLTVQYSTCLLSQMHTITSGPCFTCTGLTSKSLQEKIWKLLELQLLKDQYPVQCLESTEWPNLLHTSNMTGRHRGRKRKLRAGYRAPSLKRRSQVAMRFHCWVWGITCFLCAMHAFEDWESSSSPRLPLCQISFLLWPPLLS